MKSKILTFIIGLLLGAIIATTGFLIYSKNVSSAKDNDQNTEMFKPGEDGKNMENPPEKPSGSNEQPPEMKDENTNKTSN